MNDGKQSLIRKIFNRDKNSVFNGVDRKDFIMDVKDFKSMAKEQIEEQLAKTESCIKEADALIVMAAILNDEDMISKLLNTRIELAGFEGELKFLKELVS